MKRQVHTTYRGRHNRKFRKAINLRVSQFRRSNGIAPWERLTFQQYMLATYSGVFEPMKVSFLAGPMCQLIVKIPVDEATP